jgi:hypothetical protein
VIAELTVPVIVFEERVTDGALTYLTITTPDPPGAPEPPPVPVPSVPGDV